MHFLHFLEIQLPALRSYEKSQAFDGLVQWGILIPKGMGLVQLQKFGDQNLHNVIF